MVEPIGGRVLGQALRVRKARPDSGCGTSEIGCGGSRGLEYSAGEAWTVVLRVGFAKRHHAGRCGISGIGRKRGERDVPPWRGVSDWQEGSGWFLVGGRPLAPTAAPARHQFLLRHSFVSGLCPLSCLRTGVPRPPMSGLSRTCADPANSPTPPARVEAIPQACAEEVVGAGGHEDGQPGGRPPATTRSPGPPCRRSACCRHTWDQAASRVGGAGGPGVRLPLGPTLASLASWRLTPSAQG